MTIPSKTKYFAFLLSLVAIIGVSFVITRQTQQGSPLIGREQSTIGVQRSLNFIENVGQLNPAAGFYARTPQTELFFTNSGYMSRFKKTTESKSVDSHVISVEFGNGSRRSAISNGSAKETVNIFKGTSESWRTGIPTSSSLRYGEVWDGIDIVYDGSKGNLEAIYEIRANADPSQIHLDYSGQISLNVDENNNLVYETNVGMIHETAPIAWQGEGTDKKAIAVNFALLDADTVGFVLGDYDQSKPLTIDPSLQFATYIGGSSGDLVRDVANDSSGNIYLLGSTGSSDFPTATGPDSSINGGNDVFVTKLDSTGSTVIFSGFIGGSDADAAAALSVDSSGNVYLTGSTFSSDFPIVGGVDSSYNGSSDAFFAKLDSSGTSLLISSYLGSADYDDASGIGIDGSGNIFLSGSTNSTSFPTAGSLDNTYNGGSADGFVTKIASTGNSITYSGYIGGSEIDYTSALAVSSSGNPIVVGTTHSTESTFPVTVGPDLTYNDISNTDAFVVKVNSSGTGYDFAGYIGGVAIDEGYSVALDSSDNIYVTGRTGSTTGFPTVTGPDTSFNSPFTFDAFITKINSSGTSVIYSGFIGGSYSDYGFSVAVDSDGSAYVSGRTDTDESTFPVALGPDLTYNGGLYGDAFIVKVNPSGTGFIYGSYIGGSETENGWAVSVDSSGAAYVGGFTESSEASFPDGDGFGSVPGIDQTYSNGDGFLVKIDSQPAYIKVGGVVTSPYGLPLRNIEVKLTDQFNNVYTSTTSSFGIYSFNVEAGGTYSIVPSSKRYRFVKQLLTIREPNLDLDFQGLE